MCEIKAKILKEGNKHYISISFYNVCVAVCVLQLIVWAMESWEKMVRGKGSLIPFHPLEPQLLPLFLGDTNGSSLSGVEDL